jgi:hypothetical protein
VSRDRLPFTDPMSPRTRVPAGAQQPEEATELPVSLNIGVWRGPADSPSPALDEHANASAVIRDAGTVRTSWTTNAGAPTDAAVVTVEAQRPSASEPDSSAPSPEALAAVATTPGPYAPPPPPRLARANEAADSTTLAPATVASAPSLPDPTMGVPVQMLPTGYVSTEQGYPVTEYQYLASPQCNSKCPLCAVFNPCGPKKPCFLKTWAQNCPLFQKPCFLKQCFLKKGCFASAQCLPTAQCQPTAQCVPKPCPPPVPSKQMPGMVYAAAAPESARPAKRFSLFAWMKPSAPAVSSAPALAPVPAVASAPTAPVAAAPTSAPAAAVAATNSAPVPAAQPQPQPRPQPQPEPVVKPMWTASVLPPPNTPVGLPDMPSYQPVKPRRSLWARLFSRKPSAAAIAANEAAPAPPVVAAPSPGGLNGTTSSTVVPVSAISESNDLAQRGQSLDRVPVNRFDETPQR